MSSDSVDSRSGYVGLKAFLFVVPVYPLMLIASLGAILQVWDGETDVDTMPMLLAFVIASFVVVLPLLIVLRLGLNRLAGFRVPAVAPFIVAAAAWFVGVASVGDIATYGPVPSPLVLVAMLTFVVGPLAVWIWWRLLAKKLESSREP